jgi:hypothetical protein
VFQQIGCLRKSISFGNHFLDVARIVAIDRAVEHMIKKKGKARDVQLLSGTNSPVFFSAIRAVTPG